MYLLFETSDRALEYLPNMYCITLTKTSVVKVSEESVRARNPPFVLMRVCV